MTKVADAQPSVLKKNGWFQAFVGGLDFGIKWCEPKKSNA